MLYYSMCSRVDLDKDRVKIKLSIPKLRTKGNYTISGRILMLPISGSGESRGNYCKWIDLSYCQNS